MIASPLSTRYSSCSLAEAGLPARHDRLRVTGTVVRGFHGALQPKCGLAFFNGDRLYVSCLLKPPTYAQIHWALPGGYGQPWVVGLQNQRPARDAGWLSLFAIGAFWKRYRCAKGSPRVLGAGLGGKRSHGWRSAARL